MTNNSLYKPFSATLIVLAILFVMIIPAVSAFEFDNIKNQKDMTFDGKDVKDFLLLQKYKPIEIKNAFGFGRTQFEGYLDKHDEKCGTNCESTIKIKTGQDGVLIDDIIFKTEQEDGSWIEQDVRSYQFKYLGEINDYKYQCEVIGKYENQSNIEECENILIGSHTDWIIYNLGDEIKKGTYTVKLEAKKKPSRTVDWIIKTNGEWLESWATWGSISGGDAAEVILNSPSDLEISLTNNIQFNATANVTGGATLINMSLWTNETGSWALKNTTNTSLIGTPQNITRADGMSSGGGFTPKTGIRITPKVNIAINNITINNENTATKAYIQTSYADGIIAEADFVGNVATFPETELNAGDDYHILIDNDGASYTVFYVGGASDPSDEGDLWVNNSYTEAGAPSTNTYYSIASFYVSNYSGSTTSETNTWNRTITDTTIWNVQACDSDGDCGFSTNNYTVSLDASAPTFEVESPSGILNYNSVGNNETLNVTFTDTNLDSCWYDYNGTNVTIEGCLTGVKNSTNFTLEANNLNMTIYANDSVGNLNTTFINWSYKILQTAESFVASTASGATNPFNITLDSNSQITIVYLNYNNTASLGSISSNGDTYVLSKNQLAPGVSTATNIPFFWNITRADGFNYITTSQNQVVSPIGINQTCTDMYTIFNFTLVNELTQTKINGTAENSSIKVDLNLYTSDGNTELSSFSYEYIATNPAAICIDNNLSNGEAYSLDLQIQYKTDNHSEELYHIESYALNSSSLNQNITLYDLPTSNTQKFELLARDTSYIPISGALIKIDRKYIENGTFYTTEIPKTDAKGVTSASLETNDVIYNFYIYDDGVLISTFENVLAICQTPLVSTCSIDFNAFQTGISIPNFEDGDDFNFTLGYNSTSKLVSSTFVIPSGEPSTIRLAVISEDTLGTSVCEDTLTSATGTLTCTVPASFGNSTVLAKIYKTGIEQGRGNIKLDQDSSDIFGPILIMASVLVMLTLIGIGISDNPIVSAVFLFVGVMLLFAMNLVQNTGFYGAGATILFLAVAIILVIIKAARRT